MSKDDALVMIFDIKDSEADRSLAIDLVQSYSKILGQEN
jgi:hypothetical protein